MRKVLLTLMVLLSGPAMGQGTSDAVRVYRCVASDASVSYQDHECPVSAEATLKRMPRPENPPSMPMTLPLDEPEPPPKQANEVRQPKPRPAPPTLWLCTDHEGQERESSDGIPEGRYVPLWVVGRDPYAPAQTFGRVGQPTPLPRVQPTDGPRTSSTSQQVTTPLVYVEERCRALPPQEACDRYNSQRSELQRKMFNSQSSDRAKLAPEAERLKRLINESC